LSLFLLTSFFHTQLELKLSRSQYFSKGHITCYKLRSKDFSPLRFSLQFCFFFFSNLWKKKKKSEDNEKMILHYSCHFGRRLSIIILHLLAKWNITLLISNPTCTCFLSNHILISLPLSSLIVWEWWLRTFHFNPN